MAALSTRRLLKIGALLVAFGVVWVAAASLFVERAARGRTWSDPAAIPARRAGLVLGCARLLGGYRNPFFDSRIGAAARLFRAGKVECLIVSGDNHVRGYDEPKDMKDALVQAGVPPDRVVCDYAGFRTLDSIVRVREIFGQTAITVVSQEFHNQRAIFIARYRGVDAIGFNAPDVDTYDSFKIECRELVARANMLLDLFVLRREPKFLGKKVRLGGALHRRPTPSPRARFVQPAAPGMGSAGDPGSAPWGRRFRLPRGQTARPTLSVSERYLQRSTAVRWDLERSRTDRDLPDLSAFGAGTCYA